LESAGEKGLSSTGMPLFNPLFEIHKPQKINKYSFFKYDFGTLEA
tara:strand:+ start:778 stop:912 length:135 start_codon:yes stop_codon:yes gene_type:complete